MLLGEIRQATQLWVITDSKESDTQQLCKQLAACNTARDNLLSGLISFDDYLDVLNDNSVDIEDYSETVEDNLKGIYG